MGGGRCVWGWEHLGGEWEGETGGDDGAGGFGATRGR
jgi:hypothetical protein